MKTIEELNALKAEFEAVTGKLEGLSEEELETVTGGRYPWIHQRFARSASAVPGDDNIILKGKNKGLSDDELNSVSGGYADPTERNWQFIQAD